MRTNTRIPARRTPRATSSLKPLCAAFLVAFGLGASPMAAAALAPNVADTFFQPARGLQQPNNAQQPFIKVAPGYVGLVKFDLSTLPANTKPEQVERATAIFSVQKAAAHGGIDAHVVLNGSRWSEVSGVGLHQCG